MKQTAKNDFRKTIGKRLQQLRKRAGYSSAKSFAESIGFNPNTYTQYEQGLSGFNYEQAWVMADALKCSLDDLGGRALSEMEVEPSLGTDERKLVGRYRESSSQGKQLISESVEKIAAAMPEEKPSLHVELRDGMTSDELAEEIKRAFRSAIDDGMNEVFAAQAILMLAEDRELPDFIDLGEGTTLVNNVFSSKASKDEE